MSLLDLKIDEAGAGEAAEVADFLRRLVDRLEVELKQRDNALAALRAELTAKGVL